MNYTLIESFCALANRLNFTKAAEDLFVTQPTLSRNIAALENELGVQMFHRSKHSVALTDMGKLFLPYAQNVKKAHEDVDQFVRALSISGTSAILKEIRLGISTLQFTKILPEFISYMNAQFPSIRFKLVDGTKKELLEQLKDKKVDIIFTDGQTAASEKGIETLWLNKSYIKLVLSRNHVLAKNGTSISIGRFSELGLPLLAKDLTLIQWAKENCPEVEMQQIQSDTHRMCLIEAGLGFSLCQEGAKDIFSPDVVFLDIEGNMPISMDAVIAWNEDFPSTPWNKKLIDNIKGFVEYYSK